jgi:hypothetical protein
MNMNHISNSHFEIKVSLDTKTASLHSERLNSLYLVARRLFSSTALENRMLSAWRRLEDQISDISNYQIARKLSKEHITLSISSLGTISLLHQCNRFEFRTVLNLLRNVFFFWWFTFIPFLDSLLILIGMIHDEMIHFLFTIHSHNKGHCSWFFCKLPLTFIDYICHFFWRANAHWKRMNFEFRSY